MIRTVPPEPWRIKDLEIKQRPVLQDLPVHEIRVLIRYMLRSMLQLLVHDLSNRRLP